MDCPKCGTPMVKGTFSIKGMPGVPIRRLVRQSLWFTPGDGGKKVLVLDSYDGPRGAAMCPACGISVIKSGTPI